MEENAPRLGLFSENMEVYKMPNEYKGSSIKHGGITTFQPRKWTSKEIEWVMMLKNKGLSINSIAECIDRDAVQVSIKIKRIGKKNKTYNSKHFKGKSIRNDLFIDYIKPHSILDLFAGEVSYYRKFNGITVVSNDKFFTLNDYNTDAFKCLSLLHGDNKTFDIVDLDPFGSAVECFDLAVKVASKGLIVTFGEMGHIRFKRIDFVSKHYGISTLEDFTIENLISKVIYLGKQIGKVLTPLYICNWKRISRVYFTVNLKPCSMK